MEELAILSIGHVTQIYDRDANAFHIYILFANDCLLMMFANDDFKGCDLLV